MLHILSNVDEGYKEEIDCRVQYYVWDSDDFTIVPIFGDALMQALEAGINFNNIIYFGGKPFIMSDNCTYETDDLWKNNISLFEKKGYTVLDVPEYKKLFLWKKGIGYRVSYSNLVVPQLKKRGKLSFVYKKVYDNGTIIDKRIIVLGRVSIESIKKQVLLNPNKIFKPRLNTGYLDTTEIN